MRTATGRECRVEWYADDPAATLAEWIGERAAIRAAYQPEPDPDFEAVRRAGEILATNPDEADRIVLGHFAAPEPKALNVTRQFERGKAPQRTCKRRRAIRVQPVEAPALDCQRADPGEGCRRGFGSTP